MPYQLRDLIDIEQFQILQDRLNEIYSFPSAIIDNDGNILTATAWQDVCLNFHRKNKESAKDCIQSDQYILSHLHEANPAVSYRCPRGLVDNATPIIIDGAHYGNFFTGQFFLEEPDLNFFRTQARRFGFDEESYLEAVKKVPVWTQEKLNSYLFFIKGLIAVISESGLKNLREAETRRKIEESEERAATILSQMHDGFWIISQPDGKVIDTNEAMCRLLGYTREELLKMSVADVEANDPPEVIAARIQHIIQTGSSHFESRFRRKDGTFFDVEISVNYLPKRQFFFGFHRDITDRKRAEEEREKLQAQLNQAQKMESIGRLAGGVAHDFNNLLGVIIGHTELALEQIGPEHPLQADLLEIQKAVQRSVTLTRQLLAFARKQTAAPRVLDLNEAVESLLRMMRRLLGEGIDLVWEPAAGLWPVEIDPGQVDQILANLCVNARDAIEGAGRVTVETKNFVCRAPTNGPSSLLPGEYVLLAVSDNGCGMGQHILDNIFEPFFTTKGVGLGTGLGLATVYGIVKQNRGGIEVESEPGRGTAFKVYFPRHAGQAVEIREEKLEKPLLGRGETILLVEDDPGVLNMGRVMLERLGYRVLAATGPEAALRLAEKNAGAIRLLLTDVIMPGMNGRELAARLGATYPDLKVLFMSGYTADVIARHGVLEKGLQFIQKPFSLKVLGAKVREALDGKVP